jgi:lipopolysaccharide/colanic/teichoic acid biosynthesis glycosyltransferase
MNAVHITKRTIDVIVGATIFLFIAPLMFLIAVAVKITSPGPIFYRQRRMGVMCPKTGHNVEFSLYKFRTMALNAEKTTGPVLSKKGDPRITPIGGFLRRTRLDELPQFLNVLAGQMSIVGPRPERPELMAALSTEIPFFEERTRFLKPGITGLAQVSLEYDGHMTENSGILPIPAAQSSGETVRESVLDGMRVKFLYDMVYSSAIERFGSFLRTDLTIMFRTPLVMFIHRTGR